MKIKKVNISRKTIIISIIAACILIPVTVYAAQLAYILYFRETPTIVNTVGEADGNRPSDIPSAEESGIDNILLFGVDNRTPNDHGRTDSIIIATIDKNAKVLKLTSVMRDLYVEIGSTKSMDRINSAYAYGGPELAMKTINNNFGLDLKYYAIIDFKAFQELVDKLGGIDVEIKDYEISEINYYISEVNGNKATLLTKSGFQHINGQQALSFARIRKVGNGDFERTERQRIVLKGLAERTKQVNIMKVPELLTTLASYVETNVPLSKIISLGITAYGFNGSLQTMRVPVDGYFQGQSVHDASVLVPDIKANAMFVKEFIYNMKSRGDKDMPAYMQNNFHANDNLVASRPIPNIPVYSTPPTVTEKPEEGTKDIPPGGKAGEIPTTPAGNNKLDGKSTTQPPTGKTDEKPKDESGGTKTETPGGKLATP